MSHLAARPVRLALTAVISLALVGIAFRNVQLDDFVLALARLDAGLLLLAMALYFVDLALRAVRWKVLIGGAARVALWQVYVGLVVGYAANNLLPARVGELARALATGRLSGARPATLLGTIVVERVLDGLTVVGLLALLLPLLPAADWVRAAILAGAVVFGLLLAVLVLAVAARARLTGLTRRLLTVVPPSARKRALGIVEAGLGGVAASLSPGAALLAVLLSVVIWLAGATIYLVVAAAFGVSLPLWWWVIAICLVNLATSLPLAPAGLGAFELALVALLTLAGVPETTGAPLTLALHGVLFLPVVVAGLLCVWGWGLSLRPAPEPRSLAADASLPPAP
ncbi:MAG: flippase-like domain-containing protein [Chloroflexi bacterium]|nr:flippase-like domain-containing protein [Chloroflexota bacterium]